MSGGIRRGGIPGPESRTGLVRPTMTEAEFERRNRMSETTASSGPAPAFSPAPAPAQVEAAAPEPVEAPPAPTAEAETSARSTSTTRTRVSRVKPAAKPKRVQRMFAIEEDLDKKLWLYAIHMGKDRSEVVNDLLRPLVASMVLYDSRDRRGARASADASNDRGLDGEGEAA